MGSQARGKPHAICIPYPAQGHINSMLKLAKLLHQKGFHITFVNTEYNHKRLLRSQGPHSLDGLPHFHFDMIPDGLPPSDADSTQDIPSLCASLSEHGLLALRSLLVKLQEQSQDGVVPPVTCIVSDRAMTFASDAAEALKIPEVVFGRPVLAGCLLTLRIVVLSRMVTPLKDPAYLSNGYLKTTVSIRLRDFPTFIRTLDPQDIMLNYTIQEVGRSSRASAVILNTFNTLKHDVLESLSSVFPCIYTIGPLQLLADQIQDEAPRMIGGNLWREDPGCLPWLDLKDPGSVVYVNFGSVTVMTAGQLTEFVWGLADNQKPFLWIIRLDLVAGESVVLPPEFMEEIAGRGMLASWCWQEEVLKHWMIGGFPTHSRWNLTLESLCGSMLVILAWLKLGVNIDNDVKRDEVEGLVRELMEGEEGTEIMKKAMEWKAKAEEAIMHGGTSYNNVDKLIYELLSSID
ncbi:hypothetical protein ACJRO7_036122 [Eucalyptus globulus]|uniref:Glycosyltransferase N-terminal domain-containing protein n=1 Tax=Eucalyptus globulus TaxID=34317 RepID=A0ABD3J9H0_EUCGL